MMTCKTGAEHIKSLKDGRTVYIDGKPEVARGTACKQPDGSWRPVG